MSDKKEFEALAAQALALQIIITSVFSKLIALPALRVLIADGFDQAADVATGLSMSIESKSGATAMKNIEEIRSVIFPTEAPLGASRTDCP